MSTVLSLFSGCGGFDMGAVAAQHAIAAAYDIDPAACATYDALMPGVVHNEDLTRINMSTVPDVDGIIGGPPCQDWSLAGKRAGQQGERNMFPTMLNIIRAKRPRWCVLENVVGLATWHSGDYLRSMGYVVGTRILNAADFGVPQTRKRLFIVATRDGATYCWPEPTHEQVQLQPRLFGDALQSWVPWSGGVHLLGDERPLPRWLTSRLRKLPESAFFSRQMSHQQRPKPIWRPADKPSLTVTCGDGGNNNPIWYAGRGYRMNPQLGAWLQTMPVNAGLTIQQIGNAVPPVLAQRVLEGIGKCPT